MFLLLVVMSRVELPKSVVIPTEKLGYSMGWRIGATAMARTETAAAG